MCILNEFNFVKQIDRPVHYTLSTLIYVLYDMIITNICVIYFPQRQFSQHIFLYATLYQVLINNNSFQVLCKLIFSDLKKITIIKFTKFVL